MRLRYTRPALSDLASILEYIAEQSPQGAKRVQAHIPAVTELLTRHPLAGAQTDTASIRRMPTSPYPYLVFYEVTAETIIIHAVRHAARDPASHP